MRIFLAIELPESIRAELAILAERLRQCGMRSGWVKPDRMHLTVRFYGNISTAQVETLIQWITPRYAELSPFSLALQGTGVFPGPRKPSVVWAGLATVPEPLQNARQIAEAGAQQIGLAPEKRPFRPHLTLARIRNPQFGPPLLSLLKKESHWRTNEFQVSDVALFHSNLKPSGPVYTRIARFTLSGNGERNLS